MPVEVCTSASNERIPGVVGRDPTFGRVGRGSSEIPDPSVFRVCGAFRGALAALFAVEPRKLQRRQVAQVRPLIPVRDVGRDVITVVRTEHGVSPREPVVPACPAVGLPDQDILLCQPFRSPSAGGGTVHRSSISRVISPSPSGCISSYLFRASTTDICSTRMRLLSYIGAFQLLSSVITIISSSDGIIATEKRPPRIVACVHRLFGGRDIFRIIETTAKGVEINVVLLLLYNALKESHDGLVVVAIVVSSVVVVVVGVVVSVVVVGVGVVVGVVCIVSVVMALWRTLSAILGFGLL